MALPLLKDVMAGGNLNQSMDEMNALANNMHLRRYNRAKADNAPLSLKAEAASKLAYANLMGPQFMAKLMTDPGFLGNTSSPQLNAIREMITKAGTGQGAASNIFNQMQNSPQYSGTGQPSTNSFSGRIKDAFHDLIGQGQKPSNPFANPMPQQESAQQSFQSPQMQQPNEQPNPMSANSHRPKNGVSVEGEQWYDKNGNPVYEEDIEQPNGSEMKLELTKGVPRKTYAEKTGEYQGTVEQRKQEGKYRADALNQIGQSQLGLSNSGAVLDRMTGIVTNPVFSNMRNKIPGFQNKQLDYLKVMGTPEEKELIGDFLSTGESFIASTVQGFSGKPLVREFDLAQRQKITGHDTVESATGKLRSARTLHDIAEKKNDIVSELLKKGYNESDAVRMANKMVDVSAIEKETNARLQRKITVTNDKTGESKQVTIEEARKLGVPNV